MLTPATITDFFWGRGFGAAIDRKGLTTDVVKVWQTELQYHAIFYWTGLVGVLLLLVVLWRYLMLLRSAESRSAGGASSDALFIALVGSLTALVMNATNPYLQAPGHMWVVFFPIMIAIGGAQTHDPLKVEAELSANRRDARQL